VKLHMKNMTQDPTFQFPTINNTSTGLCIYTDQNSDEGLFVYLWFIKDLVKSRDSPIGIATAYGLGGRGSNPG
jgi:hypothetical protein